MPNEVLCTDGHANYEGIAKDERILLFALNAGPRTKYTPRIHHTNTVNALISRFPGFVSPSADNFPDTGGDPRQRTSQPAADGMPLETTWTASALIRSGCCSLHALAPTRFGMRRYGFLR